MDNNTKNDQNSLREHLDRNIDEKFVNDIKNSTDGTEKQFNDMFKENIKEETKSIDKVLNVKYHTQINNKILRYSSCGTTATAMYLNYLNDKFNKNYECDDDKVFEILNGPEMNVIAKDMVKKGIIDKSALDVRTDNINTNILESNYNHLNNLSDVLAKLCSFITKKEYIFKTTFLDANEIKSIIDKGYPVVISGKFTASGHFVLIIGYDENNNYIVHDPFGDYNKAYAKDTLGQGSSLKYNIDKVMSIATIKNPLNKAKCLIISV